MFTISTPNRDDVLWSIQISECLRVNEKILMNLKTELNMLHVLTVSLSFVEVWLSWKNGKTKLYLVHDEIMLSRDLWHMWLGAIKS